MAIKKFITFLTFIACSNILSAMDPNLWEKHQITSKLTELSSKLYNLEGKLTDLSESLTTLKELILDKCANDFFFSFIDKLNKCKWKHQSTNGLINDMLVGTLALLPRSDFSFGTEETDWRDSCRLGRKSNIRLLHNPKQNWNTKDDFPYFLKIDQTTYQYELETTHQWKKETEDLPECLTSNEMVEKITKSLELTDSYDW